MAGVIAVSSVVKAEEETYNKSKRLSPTLGLHIDTNGQPAIVPKHSPIEHPEETVLARAERKSSMNATLTEEVCGSLNILNILEFTHKHFGLQHPSV